MINKVAAADSFIARQIKSYLPSSHSLMAGFLIAGVGLFLMGVSHIGTMLLLSTVLWSLGEIIVFLRLTHYVSGVSSQRTLDRNLGYYSAGVNIGVMIASTLAFMLVAKSLLLLPWLVASMVLLLFGIAISLMKRSATLWNKDA